MNEYHVGERVKVLSENENGKIVVVFTDAGFGRIIVRVELDNDTILDIYDPDNDLVKIPYA